MPSRRCHLIVAALLQRSAFRSITCLARRIAFLPHGFPQKMLKTRQATMFKCYLRFRGQTFGISGRRGHRAYVCLTGVFWLVLSGASLSGAAPPVEVPASVRAEAPLATPTPATILVTRVEARLRARHLQLPSYARVGADPLAPLPDLPAFTEDIEVVGKPMDTKSLTLKMQWWMDDFEPMYGGAGPARFHAPTLAEMSEHRPMPPRAADFTPVVGWLLGKLKKDGGEKSK
jgi:hypothetical protein